MLFLYCMNGIMHCPMYYCHFSEGEYTVIDVTLPDSGEDDFDDSQTSFTACLIISKIVTLGGCGGPVSIWTAGGFSHLADTLVGHGGLFVTVRVCSHTTAHSHAACCLTGYHFTLGGCVGLKSSFVWNINTFVGFKFTLGGCGSPVMSNILMSIVSVIWAGKWPHGWEWCGSSFPRSWSDHDSNLISLMNLGQLKDLVLNSKKLELKKPKVSLFGAE